MIVTAESTTVWLKEHAPDYTWLDYRIQLRGIAKIKSIRALRSEVATKFVSLPPSGYLPVVADIDAWLKANPMPVAPPPAK